MRLILILSVICGLGVGCEERQNDAEVVEKCVDQEQNVTQSSGSIERGHAPKSELAPYRTRENPAALMNDALAAIKKKGKLVVVTDPRLPPLEYKEGKKLVGFDVDFLTAIAKRFEIKVEFIETPWENVYDQLESGAADIAVAGIKTSSETDKRFDYLEYSYMPQVFVSFGKQKVEHERQLVGKTVGVLSGSKTREMFELFKVNGLAIKRIYGQDNGDLLLKALEEGLIDVAVMDQTTAKYLAKSRPNTYVSGFAIVHEPLGIAMRKDNRGLQLLLERTVRAMSNEGTTSDLFEQWFGHPLGH